MLEILSSYIAANIRFLNFCFQDQTHGLVKTALAKTRKTFAMLVVNRNSLCTFISLFLVLDVLPHQSCAICKPLHRLLWMTVLEESHAGGGGVGKKMYQLWNRDYVNRGDRHHRQNDQQLRVQQELVKGDRAWYLGKTQPNGVMTTNLHRLHIWWERPRERLHEA